MADVSIQVDVRAALGALGAISGDGLQRKLSAALQEAALFGERQVVGFTPVKTGALRASVKASRMGPLGWKIASPLAYAAAVELGSRPHVIRARGGLLRFTVGGNVVYARQVNHPGTKPKRMFARGAEALRGQLSAILGRHLAP